MSKKNKKDKKKKNRDEQRTPVAAAEKSGVKLDLRTVELPARPKPMKPSDIRALRESLNASQTLFARLLNVSSNAVESWEQGIREPRQATLKLLHIARKSPDVLLS
ncbi:MAG TPA: helix-turn-helix domain-containing protein [Verrucomicrobiae bacterium]|jgi:DNA-binding transcriptional regulator YiaG|nr:helix-turn-helix domain-containing protein [Verrucomicrobiae bacterium]